MTRGATLTAAVVTALNTPAPPSGVPEASRLLGLDIPPESTNAIRVLPVKEPILLVHGGRIARKAVRILAVECWAKGDGETPVDDLVDPLLEHVISRLEGDALGGLAHFAADAEIQWKYSERDGSWCRATVLLPVQYHTQVGSPA